MLKQKRVNRARPPTIVSRTWVMHMCHQNIGDVCQFRKNSSTRVFEFWLVISCRYDYCNSLLYNVRADLNYCGAISETDCMVPNLGRNTIIITIVVISAGPLEVPRTLQWHKAGPVKRSYA